MKNRLCSMTNSFLSKPVWFRASSKTSLSLAPPGGLSAFKPQVKLEATKKCAENPCTVLGLGHTTDWEDFSRDWNQKIYLKLGSLSPFVFFCLLASSLLPQNVVTICFKGDNREKSSDDTSGPLLVGWWGHWADRNSQLSRSKSVISRLWKTFQFPRCRGASSWTGSIIQTLKKEQGTF